MPRTLTQRDLNRALLARQLLLERSPAPLPRALERMPPARAAAAGAGADRRDPGAVRPLDVLRAVVAPARPGPAGDHARAGAALSRAGDADALDHPPCLARGLLAARARGRRGAPALVGALGGRRRGRDALRRGAAAGGAAERPT